MDFERALEGRRILVTGHTGFTGGWACLWLKRIGAEPVGFSLVPETNPSLFEALGLENDIPTIFGDITDFSALRSAVQRFQPDAILHLAAQPLVRRSYREPLETFLVNCQGTAHVLEAARHVSSVRGVLCITTDKVYENREWPWAYRENDPLGGKDPYSASKAAAEMVIRSYVAMRDAEQVGPHIATARGGNIIGGGDWSEDRLVPDFVRAVIEGSKLTLRYPDAVRPWQHVLALVHGYFRILGGLVAGGEEAAAVSRSWNFGPQDTRQYSVRDVLELMSSAWLRPDLDYMDQPLPEALSLALDSSLARNKLGWTPSWSTAAMIGKTAEWYRTYYEDPSRAREVTLAQIDEWRAGLGR